ncbi:hypothetical protein [Scytonema sp. NUACC26]|uniref:hypothetical protein n=1 Tax=Scytonema sp. NUACC26 TaxID=3140176 RepID=UPI0034DBCB52
MIATSAVFCQIPLQKNLSSCLSQIQEATLALLEAASELALIQKSIGKIGFSRELKKYQQNPKDVKEYLALVHTYSECDLEEISSLGILTLKKLARPSYTPVREALENLIDITPIQIDDLTKTLCKRQRQSKEPRTTIWGEDGQFFNTGDIYDRPEAGVALERMAKEEGKTTQTITAQSIELRQEVIQVLQAQQQVTDITLKASPVEGDNLSLNVTLNSTLPKLKFQDREFILLDATKKYILELDKLASSPIQLPNVSIANVEQQRTLEKIRQYQAYLSAEKDIPKTSLDELSLTELKAVEVLLEGAIGQADCNKIRDAIAKISPDRKEKVWFALSYNQRTKALKLFPPHYRLLTQAVKNNLIYDFREDKSGKAVKLRINNTMPGMFDNLVSIENIESFLNTLSPREYVT